MDRPEMKQPQSTGSEAAHLGIIFGALLDRQIVKGRVTREQLREDLDDLIREPHFKRLLKKEVRKMGFPEAVVATGMSDAIIGAHEFLQHEGEGS
jgi:hypothetical protein